MVIEAEVRDKYGNLKSSDRSETPIADPKAQAEILAMIKEMNDGQRLHS